jgi:cytidine deaminase
VDQATRARLETAARKAAGAAYCPYSHFRVGAAVLTEDQLIFSGTNVENVSFGLTICAERNAIHSAITQGQREIRAVVIYTPTAMPTAPCGACRQVIREFGPNAEIVCVCDSEAVIKMSCEALLPAAFSPSHVTPAPRSQPRPARSTVLRRLCIDIDNVIARTDEVIRSVISEFTNQRVQLTYDDLRHDNYWECRAKNGNSISRDEWLAIYERFSQPKYLLAIQPVEGVREYLAALTPFYNLHFVTSRLVSARSATVEWLNQHAFPKHDLHFLQAGEKHRSLGEFAASVEADLAQAESCSEQGIRRSYLIAHPWNASPAHQPGLRRVTGWPQLVDELLELHHNASEAGF